MTPRILAHRGASAQEAENTAAAFVAARDLGADGVELDVRRTADGALAIHHDAALADGLLLVEHELTQLRLRQPTLLTLESALDVCQGMLVNIEIKNSPGDPDHDPSERVAQQVVELLDERSPRADTVVISSFSLPTIDRVRALESSLPTSLLTMGEDPLAMLDVAEAHGHGGINPFFGMLTEATAGEVCVSAQHRGLTVTPWTVDDPETIVRLAAAGVDAIITNVPDVARRALTASKGTSGDS